MKQDARIIAYGHWGTNRPAFSFALTGAAMMRQAYKFGSVSGVDIFRADDKSHQEEKSVGSFPIGLSRLPVFNDADNAKTAWTNLVGGTDYLEQFPNPFSGDTPGLGHSSDAPAAYQGVLVPQNTGHILRLFLHKAPEHIAYPLFIANWDGWQFQIADNSASLMRLAPTWTQSDETALVALLGIKEPTTPQQDQIADLKTSLYADSASVQLEGDKSNSFGSFYELEFVPEAGGKVSVYCNGKLGGVADHTPILKSRQPGILWNEAPLVLRRNGGHFFWQTGYPLFSGSGEIRWKYRLNYELEPLENMVFTKVASTPAGTSVVLSQDKANSEIVASFATSNRRITPFLYLAQAYLDAGVRGGDNYSALMEVSWDSEAEKNKFGTPPILEIEPQCEGELRRGQYNVQVSDVNGQSLSALGFYYEALEHRVCDLYIGNPPLSVIKNGIVKSATRSDWGSAQSNQAPSQVARPDTTAQLEICDAWSLLEEHELEGGELVGDGLRLGVLLRRALRRIGTPWDEMAGIPDGTFLSGQPKSAAGRELPKAAISDDGWAVVNSSGTLADFIYYLIERFGMGRILWRGRDGVWYFTRRSTTTRVLNGYEVHFKSDASGHNHPDTYPGRFAMLRPIDLPRDASEFYNKYRVRGAEGYDDEPLVREWTIQESITRGGGAGSRKFIGRAKRLRAIDDSSLRTAADVQYSLRSAVELHGLPPRFLSFETYFHSGLFVGDRVKADGENYIVRRISGGSWKEDRMNLLLQEVGY